ncbi:unnamed protein product [Rhizoctonia solani]|uniref:Uncharacterized protein n=1 Tax=Rhizoctonia solani TaxID=456999 RepID=A0A8H3HSU9_9AGAM|nr:unnamed protein product [Rhizoctonia solani]
MKFSSSANIALASIALSSPNLLSSPVFVNAAPTGGTGSLSPNLGAGYFGTSPQMHATDSPVMPTMPSPPTSKIAGQRRSLRRSRTIKRRNGEKASRNIDPLGLGVNAGAIQSGAESILHSRMVPGGSSSGAQGTVDPFSPIVGPGGLLANTGLVPPNTPMLGGVPLSNGVDPSMLLGAIPGVDNVIPIIQNTVTGAPGTVLSSLTAGSLPFVNGLLPNLGAPPIALPQVLGTSTPGLGVLPQLAGGYSPLTGGLSSVQGVAAQVPGVLSQLPDAVPSVSGVTQALPIAVPDVNRLAPPAIVPNVGAVPNVSMPPLSGALPQVPGLVTGAPQLAGGIPQVPDAVSQEGEPWPLAESGRYRPRLRRARNPVALASMVPVPSVALPTSVSALNALPTSMLNLNALPTVTATNLLAQPIESLAPADPLFASNSVPHILVSGPDGVGMFEPLEGVGAGAMGRPDYDGAQTESTRPEKGYGVRPGMPENDKGAQTTSGTKSAVESRTTSWSTTQSERPMADRTTSELAPTNLARPSAKLDVPTTSAFFTSKPTVTDAPITTSPEPTLIVDGEILPVRKRWESKSPSLHDIGSAVTDESGSPLLSDGVPVPTPPVYLPSATRLRVSSQDSLGVSRSASVVTLKSFSMASITEGVAPIPAPAQTAPPVIGGIRSSLDMAQPAGLAPTISDDSLSGHSSSDERPLLISPTITAAASSPIATLYTGGVPLSRTFERSADTPLSAVPISGDSPNVPSPASLGSGTPMDSQDTATRKIFRWGVPKMVTSTIRSVATAVKK